MPSERLFSRRFAANCTKLLLSSTSIGALLKMATSAYVHPTIYDYGLAYEETRNRERERRRERAEKSMRKDRASRAGEYIEQSQSAGQSQRGGRALTRVSIDRFRLLFICEQCCRALSLRATANPFPTATTTTKIGCIPCARITAGKRTVDSYDHFVR